MMRHLVTISLLMMSVTVAQAANLLVNGDMTYNYNSLVTYHATGLNANGETGSPSSPYGWPVTVSSTGDFQYMVGEWVRQQAGDYGDVAPSGTGNDTDYCWTARKGFYTIQMLAKDTVSSGDQLALNWRYHEDLDVEVEYTVEIIGLNEAGDGEADTTISLLGTALTFGGEEANSAILATSTVNIAAGSGDTVWHDAAETLYTLSQDWDYVGIAFRRTKGAANDMSQQMDTFSLEVAPEPATMGLLSLGGLALLRRRKRK